jgi:UDP-glucuronate 4-epimerase
MRALITGAAGFIGSQLAERLHAEGWHVRGVDSVTPYYDQKIKRLRLDTLRSLPAVEVFEQDLRTVDLEPLLHDVDVVFHLAAQPGVRQSWDQFGEYVDQNVMATHRLLEEATRHKLTRFVFASSSSVYGQISGSVDESAPTLPYSPYGVTKLAAESLCGAYARNFDVPVTSLRFFTVYGPRQRPDMATHRLIRCSLLGEQFQMFGDGSYVRAFTYVDDVIDAAIAAASRPHAAGSVFNVSGGSTCSLSEVVAEVEAATGRAVPIVRKDEKAGDVARTDGVIEHARDVLGWTPKTNLHDGIARQVADLRVHLEVDSAS